MRGRQMSAFPLSPVHPCRKECRPRARINPTNLMEITRKISLQRKSVQLPFLLLTLCFSILFQANYRIVDNFSFRESITLATLPTYYLTNVNSRFHL